LPLDLRVGVGAEKQSEDGGREELRLFFFSRSSMSLSLAHKAWMMPFASSSDSALGGAVRAFLAVVTEQ
jgi:hypothetical protein